MSVRLGRIKQGTQYTVRIDADSANEGLTFAFVGWQPAPGAEPHSYPMRIEKGQSGNHALVCPPHTLYYLIEIRVDVPEPGKATLTVSGLQGESTKQVSVTQDETYWMEIIS